MAQEMDEKQMHKALFVNLVMMLSTSALQQLGKLVSPLSGKAEVHLQGAQVSIDMLSMLKRKTEGNLDRDEQRMLTDTLSSLQMNYVDVAKSAPAEPDAGAASASDEPAAAAPAASPSGETAGKDKKDPKYHKSYGQ